jgi:hypothetical protein
MIVKKLPLNFMLIAIILSSCSSPTPPVGTVVRIKESPIANPTMSVVNPIIVSESGLAALKESFPNKRIYTKAQFESAWANLLIANPSRVVGSVGAAGTSAYSGGIITFNLEKMYLTVEGDLQKLSQSFTGLNCNLRKGFSLAYLQARQFEGAVGDKVYIVWPMQIHSDSQVAIIYLGEELYTLE